MEGPETESPLISLLDADGRQRDFRVHDAFEIDEGSFYLVEAVAEPGLVLILKEGESGLESITGEEFDRVMAILEAEEA